ncbi:MAG: hypothetical protein ABH868_07165 [bacterium]
MVEAASKKRKMFTTGVILAIIVAILLLKDCMGGCKKTPPPPPPAPIVEKKVELPPPPPPAPKKKVVEKKAPVKKKEEWFQKGICYIVWSKDHYASKRSDKSLEKLVTTNAKWVGLHTTWYQEHYTSTEIYRGGKSPTDESLIHAIEKIHELGLNVMLKPHLDLINSEGGEWRGSIEFETEEEWQAWFESYTNFAVHYAKLAQENNVELYCIGTELSATTIVKPDMWRGVIKAVREVYKGPLTYASNWDGEYLDISFWSDLDYAGIDPYFPLSEAMQPSLEEIKEGWKSWFAQIEQWQKKMNQPVIFTEIGYASSTGAAKEPWEHMPGKYADTKLQEACYEALYQTFWDEPWFAGLYWWMWGGSVKIGGENHRGFSPQNKPAEETIRTWYGKKTNKNPM